MLKYLPLLLLSLGVHADSNLAGRTAVLAYKNDYSSANKASGSFFTVASALAREVNEIEIYDSSGQDLELSFAATCAALNSAYNTIKIPPGVSGAVLLSIPSGSCVGVKPISGNATTGVLLLSFLK